MQNYEGEDPMDVISGEIAPKFMVLSGHEKVVRMVQEEGKTAGDLLEQALMKTEGVKERSQFMVMYKARELIALDGKQSRAKLR